MLQIATAVEAGKHASSAANTSEAALTPQHAAPPGSQPDVEAEQAQNFEAQGSVKSKRVISPAVSAGEVWHGSGLLHCH